MGLKETKSKSFRLDQKIYNDYKNVFDKYNSETGNTNKQAFWLCKHYFFTYLFLKKSPISLNTVIGTRSPDFSIA